jgi:hypothetical protein
LGKKLQVWLLIIAKRTADRIATRKMTGGKQNKKSATAKTVALTE